MSVSPSPSTSLKVTIPTRNGQGVTISAVLYFPKGFDSTKQYAAIVVAHPGGGVKEQTSGLYARKLAEQGEGLVTIAYDASYQGESSGSPRHLENPYVRTEDISAVIDYLTTLAYVNKSRIGAMGVCAGGGYTANAAINDRRIVALATVSGVNIGAMFRNGWDNSAKPSDSIPYLEAGSNARTAEASGTGESGKIPLAPVKREDATHPDMAEAFDYYRTARCQHPNSISYATARSLTQLVTYDAFNFADIYLTQPLLIIAGDRAGSKWMSDDLFKRAASKDKTLHVVKDATHIALYDVDKYVTEAVSKLAPFFNQKLQ